MNRPSRPRSIATLVSLQVVAVSTAVVGLFGWAAYQAWARQDRETLEAEIRRTSDQLSAALALPVWNFDRDQAGRVLDAVLDDPMVWEIRVAFGPGGAAPLVKGRSGPAPSPVTVGRELAVNDTVVGSVQATFTRSLHEAALARLRRRTLLGILLLDAALVAALQAFLWRHVLRPVRDLEALSRAPGDGRLIAMPGPFPGELGTLRQAILDTFHQLQAQMEAQEESESRFRTLVQNAPEAILVADVARRRFTDANPMAERLFGRSREELFRLPFEAFYGAEPGEREALAASIDRKLALALEGRSSIFQRTILRPDGTSSVCEVQTVALPPLSEGRVRVSYVDITERLEAERALREQDARLAAMFALSPDANHLLDAKTLRYLDVSEAFETMTGYAREEVLGRTGAEVGIGVPPEDVARMLEIMRATGRVDRFETRGFHRSGRELWLEISARAGQVQGRPCYFVAARDITARRAAEAERRAMEDQLHHLLRMEALGRLAGGVAHDMNNVLAAVSTLAASIQEREPGLSKQADLILHASQRGAKLVRGLLDFARKEAGETGPVDLNAMVAKEAELLATTASQGIQVSLDLASGLPPLQGSATALSTSFMNLCVNAMDAMPKGGRLALRTRRLDPDQVALEVEDSGEGMSPEVQRRALEPFFTTKPVGKGTGLGLAIVFSATRSHGGRVEIESEVGRGTLVRMVLPLRTGAL